MRKVHFVGRPGHGKTTLVVELVGELIRQGHRVGTIKHSDHHHEMDTPGKDSYRHRQAGGRPAAFIALDRVALFATLEDSEDPYAWLTPQFGGCDLVLVEGDLRSPGIKLEVWRSAVGTAPLAAEREDIAAVISDDPLDLPVPVWPRRDLAAIVERMFAWFRQGGVR